MKLSKAFKMGYDHALERGPKSMKEINKVHAMSDEDYRDYLRGQKAGLDKILDTRDLK